MYLKSLTSLRGLLALLVVQLHILPFYYHAGISGPVPFLSTGFVAVDVFFLLSGFVLGVQSRAGADRQSYGHFIRNRVARIFPLHLVALIVTAIAIYLLRGGFDETGLENFIQSLFLVHSWGMLGSDQFNVPSWSLSVEWLLYLMFPLFLLAFSGQRPRTHITMIVCLLVGQILLAKFLFDYDQLRMKHDYGVVRGVAGFGCGIILSNYVERLQRKALPRLFEIMVYGIILYDMIAYQSAWIVSLMSPLLLIISVNRFSVTSRVLSSRYLEHLGVISYSIYLWHWPLLRVIFPEIFGYDPFAGNLFKLALLNLLFVIAVLGVSELSYRWIEAPARRLIKGIRGLPIPAALFTKRTPRQGPFSRN